MTVKFAGFNFRCVNQPGDEITSEFLEIDFNYDSKNIIIKSQSFYEVVVENNLRKFRINSSVKESLNATIAFSEEIADVQLTEDFCYILHNGKISQYDVETHEMKQPDTHFDNDSERLTLISARYESLYGVTNANCVYQIAPEFKLVHKFAKHQRISKISSGLEHTLMMTSNGDVYSFGCGLRGQLGHGDVASHESPKLIEAINGIKIVDICSSAFSSCAVSSFGDLYTFGWNSCGQLGVKRDKEGLQCQKVFTLPQVVEFLEDESDGVYRVYCGHKHTVIRTERGRLFSVGWNNFGQLAIGGEGDRDSFIEIPIKPIERESKIFCGYWSTYLV